MIQTTKLFPKDAATLKAEALIAAYQGMPLRGAFARPDNELSEETRSHIAKVRSAFAESPLDVRAEAHLRLLASAFPGDQPFAINGVPLDLPPLPPFSVACSLFSTDQAWHAMDDQTAEDIACDVAQDLHMAGYTEDAPPLDALIGMGRILTRHEAHDIARRVAEDLANGTTSDITNGLAQQLAVWTKAVRDSHMSGDELKSLREQAGLTQDQLGRMIEINRRHVARLEAGETPISPDLAQKIVAALQAVSAR